MPDEELEIPIPGHVRLPDEHSTTWLPLLRDLYWFESTRVSGPGSEHRALEGVIWSKDDVLGAVPSAASDPDEFDELGTLARQLGFRKVASGPFVRSSYHARDMADLFEPAAHQAS